MLRDQLGQYELRADRNIRTRTIDIAMFRVRGGVVDILNPLTVTTRDHDRSVVGEAPPCIHLEYEEAQQLMDELWASKVRPSGELSSLGEREAMRQHLTALQAEILFLRSIVNHQIGLVS